MCAWLWERRPSPASHQEARFSDALGKQVLMAESADQGTDWKSEGKAKGTETGTQLDASVIFSQCPPPSPSLSLEHPSSGFMWVLAFGWELGFLPHHLRCPVAMGRVILLGMSDRLTGLNTELGQFLLKPPNRAASFSFPFYFLICFLLPFWHLITGQALPRWHPAHREGLFSHPGPCATFFALPSPTAAQDSTSSA